MIERREITLGLWETMLATCVASSLVIIFVELTVISGVLMRLVEVLAPHA